VVEVVGRAVEELEAHILIMEGRELVVEVVGRAVEELEVGILILEVKVLVGVVVHTRLEMEQRLLCG
jgi:hypothetical protein